MFDWTVPPVFRTLGKWISDFLFSARVVGADRNKIVGITHGQQIGSNHVKVFESQPLLRIRVHNDLNLLRP